MDASSDKVYFADVSNRRVRVVDLNTGIINTYAGGGSADIGDGLPARQATFSTHPMRVSLDGEGHLYVTDAHQDRIRKVDGRTGLIATVAGNGREAFAGDGGPAVAASLGVPHAARLDERGHLFIADTRNHRIRKVDGATGLIATVAGDGHERFNGDGIAAVQASLSGPLSMDIDRDGHCYIADRGNFRVRRVDGRTGLISTVAGSGEEGMLRDGAAAEVNFSIIRDVLLDHRGGLYIADGGHSCIARLDLTTGFVAVVAGRGGDGFSGDGGPAREASLNKPYSIALDPEGHLYIFDADNARIRRVDARTQRIETLAGNGTRGFSGDGGPASAAAMMGSGG